MSYTPNNIQVYVAAFTGAIAGMVVSNRVLSNPNASNYSSLVAAAGAFAQSFDTVWGSPDDVSIYIIEGVQSECIAAWQERTPFTTNSFTDPGVYTELCQALITVINVGSEYLDSQGITPPDPGGGGLPELGDVIVDPNDSTKNVVQTVTGVDGVATVSAILVIKPVTDEQNLGNVDTTNYTQGNANTGIDNDFSLVLAPDNTELLLISLDATQDESSYRVEVTIDAVNADGTASASWGLRIFAVKTGGVLSFFGDSTPLFAIGNNAGSPPVDWEIGYDKAGESAIIVLANTDTNVKIMTSVQMFKVA